MLSRLSPDAQSHPLTEMMQSRCLCRNRKVVTRSLAAHGLRVDLPNVTSTSPVSTEPNTDCLPHKPSRGKKIDIGRAFGGEHVRVSPSMDMVTAQNPSYLPTVIDQDLSVSSEPIPSDVSLRICTKTRESKKCPARGWSCWALNGQGSGMKTILHLICILKALQESGSSIAVQYLLKKQFVHFEVVWHAHPASCL